MAEGIVIPVVGTVDAGFLGELQQLYGRIAAVASGIAELSTEQTRLNATSARLGVSFDAASAAAGRYVDQIELQRAAEAAAQTGLRLTQAELDALARRAAQFSQATGVEMTEAVQQLTEAVVKGEAEGLNRFGGGLAEVGRQSGTAGDRLRALVTDANATARATDDASTAAARLSGELRSVGRQASLAFTEQLADNVSRFGTDMGNAATRAEDLTEAVRGLGRFGADALTGIAALAGVVVGGIGTSVRALSHAFVELWTAQGRAMSGDFSGALASARAAFTATEELRDMADFTERSINIASDIGGRLFGDDGVGDVRGNGPSVRAPRRSDTMEFTSAEVTDANARDRPTGGGRSGGRGGSSQRATARDIEMARAEMATATEAKARTQGEAEAQLARDLAEMSAANDNKSLGSARAEMEESAAQKAAQSERTAADERIATERSLTAALREQFRERATAAQTMAGSIRGAYDSMTSAAGEHLAALVLGQETLGQALQGMLHDTLAAVAKEASIKAILETAAGIASLASFNYPSAAQHFAAAGVFAAAAVAAGAGAQAIGPASAPSSASAPSGASRASSPAPAASERGEKGTMININMSGLLAGSAQDAARQVVNLLRVGADQAGVVLPRRAVEGA